MTSALRIERPDVKYKREDYMKQYVDPARAPSPTEVKKKDRFYF